MENVCVVDCGVQNLQTALHMGAKDESTPGAGEETCWEEQVTSVREMIDRFKQATATASSSVLALSTTQASIGEEDAAANFISKELFQPFAMYIHPIFSYLFPLFFLFPFSPLFSYS